MTSRVRNLQRRARALERRPGRSDLELSRLIDERNLESLRSLSAEGPALPPPPLPEDVEQWRAANTPNVTRDQAIEALRAALGGNPYASPPDVPRRPLSGELP